MRAEVFKDDDAGFCRRRDQGGYVLGWSADGSWRPCWHRSTCHTINGTPANGASWTHLYPKAVFDDPVDIDGFCDLLGIGAAKECEFCAAARLRSGQP